MAGLTPARWDGSPADDTTPTYVYYGNVPDDWQQTTSTNIPLTTYSIWDQFVRARTDNPAYSLNRLNYDAMASLLLPRAVAYSAGLINFFFRGRIDIELPDEGVFAAADHATDKGFTMVRAKISNKSPVFFNEGQTPQPQDMSDGQFFAVIRDHKDKKYAAGLETVVGTVPCTEPGGHNQCSEARRVDAMSGRGRADCRIAARLCGLAAGGCTAAGRIRVRRIANSVRHDRCRAAGGLSRGPWERS